MKRVRWTLAIIFIIALGKRPVEHCVHVAEAAPEVRARLSRAELEKVFDLKNVLRHVDAVFDRALSQGYNENDG